MIQLPFRHNTLRNVGKKARTCWAKVVRLNVSSPGYIRSVGTTDAGTGLHVCSGKLSMIRVQGSVFLVPIAIALFFLSFFFAFSFCLFKNFQQCATYSRSSYTRGESVPTRMWNTKVKIQGWEYATPTPWSGRTTTAPPLKNVSKAKAVLWCKAKHIGRCSPS